MSGDHLIVVEMWHVALILYSEESDVSMQCGMIPSTDGILEFWRV